MEPSLAFPLAVTAASLLGLVVSLLISYWVIRLAVTHALRAHDRWQQSNRQRA